MAMNIVINMNSKNYCYQLLYVTCLLNDVGSTAHCTICTRLLVSQCASLTNLFIQKITILYILNSH